MKNPETTPIEEHQPPKKSRIFSPRQAGVAALLVTVATLLSTILGLVRDKVMAHYFGANLDTDFYNYGYTIPDTLQNILIMGVTSSSFIPLFSEYVANKSREEANRMASAFMNVTLGFFIVVCLIVGIFMPQIADVWLKRDLTPDAKEAIVGIARIFLVGQIAFGLSKILSGILQTHKHFTAYALALLVYNPAIILGIIFFHESAGIYSAAYGAAIGACLVALVNILDTLRTDYQHTWNWDWREEGVKRIFVLAIPNFLNMALLQTIFLAYSRISMSLAEGSYSAFRYALNFESFPVSIFGISFVTAIFPYLAENASKKNFVNFNYNIQNSIKQILFLTLPAGLGMAVLSHEIIGLVLGGGKFGRSEIDMTARILFFYALAVPLESLWYLFARAFYACQDTWTPFWYRLIGTVVNLSISYFFAASMGATSFSLGLFVGFFLQIILFTFGLKRRVPEFDLNSGLLGAAKLTACAMAMSVVVFFANDFLLSAPWMLTRSDRLQYLIRLLSGMGLGVGVYFSLTYIFKCADFSVFDRVLGRILKRK